MDYADEFARLSGMLDEGLRALRQFANEYAATESAYRKAKASKWVEAPTSEKRSEWTTAEREAWVNAETADLRAARDIAEGMRQAALEAVRSRRAQISALQSLLAADRAEAEFVRTAP